MCGCGYGYGKSNGYMYDVASDSKRIRSQDARQIPWSDDYEVLSLGVAWQSFEVVPNVIGPTSTTCE